MTTTLTFEYVEKIKLLKPKGKKKRKEINLTNFYSQNDVSH